MKFKPMALIVCWVCKEGGNKKAGPLLKIDGTNYAHDDCFALHGKPNDQTASRILFRDKNEKVEEKKLVQAKI